jgi:FdhD protein
MSPQADMSRLPITAAVLAGGRSMRRGVDKTLLSVDGETLIARVSEIVGEVCDHVVVVTDRPEAVTDANLPVGVAVLQDKVSYQGPLGALATALEAAPDDWVLAVAADIPWLRPEVIRLLWDARGEAQVVMPVGELGPEPLLALYHTSCLSAVKTALESGRRRVVSFLPSVMVAEVSLDALRSVDSELVSLFNVNTQADLAEAQQHATVEARPPVVPLVVKAGADFHNGKLPSERAITVYMNGVEIATIQSSPSHLEEMAVGFLLAEGLIADREALRGVDVDQKRGLVFVETTEAVPDELVYKKRYITSGCGKGITFSSVGHAKGLDHVVSDVRVEPAELLSMVQQLSANGMERKDTGGVHGCAFGRNGEVILIREDIGRHNAVDKLLGRAWLDRTPTDDLVLLTTGRVSYEMAVKAAKARIPVVVTRHAVTDLAAEITEELGVTLVAYCRGNRMVVCTHPERIREPQEKGSSA